jgi:predicted metal-dependent phosphoesterase TrpH
MVELLIDCHVHTARYSECSVLEPDQACTRARERGLNGLVLTEHQIQWPSEELDRLRAAFPDLLLFSGLEISVEEGFDIVVLTAEQELSFPLFPLQIAFDELLERLEPSGDEAFLFMAHPFRWTDRFTPQMERILTRIHGIEMNSINILQGRAWKAGIRYIPRNAHLYEEARERYNLIPMFNSDSHSERTVGAIANRVTTQRLPRNGSELAALLKRVRPEEHQNEQLLDARF